MDTTTAIIQFIGIVLFSASVPGDPGLHALMPRIGHVHKSEFHQLPLPDSKENLTDFGSMGVENHVSVIMYRDADRLYENGGWKSDGVLANGWQYLALNGERIQFLTNGENGKPLIPGELPRTGFATSCDTSGEPSLNKDFLPPYRGAIAVVDLPEGKLSSCESSARRDTRLTLSTKGVLVITATKAFEEPKALVLKGNAVVFVANIPPYTLMKDVDLTIGEPHWTAYNAMLDKTCAAAPKIAPEFEAVAVATCDLDTLGDSYLRATKSPPIEIRMIDSGCSNSQWP